MPSIGTERRQFKRYSPAERAFAVLTGGCEKLGQIKNISKGGLSFEYIADQNDKSSVGSESPGEIDIIMSRDGFYLRKIPCRIVHDGHIEPDHWIITSIPMKRCGIQFGNLNLVAADFLESCLTRCEP